MNETQSDFVTKTGTSLTDLAQQCRERFLSIMPIDTDPTPWEELSQDVTSRWMEAAHVVGEFVAQQVETTFRQLARRMAIGYYGKDTWEKAGILEKFGFEICARHVTNMVVAEDAADVKDALDYNWGEWVLRKLDTED